jgi:signal transduction histidine kinase
VILSYIDEPTVPQMLKAVRTIPPRSLILYIWQAQDEPGYNLYPDQVASMVAESAAVPIYGTSDLYLGQGVVGGVVRSTYETGGRLGEMARQILGGTRAQDIPVETSRVVPTFDWRQLQRWAIDPARLPPGSVVRFQVPTVWESYRGYIIGTVIVVAGQLVLIAGLLTQRARRRRAEETVRASEAMLRASYERIRQLAGRLINAQETARAGIARELHDGVCQDLAGVAAAVSGLKRSSGDIQDQRAQKAFAQLEGETRSMFENIRRLSHDLHPATLRLLGLPQALKAYCSEIAGRHAVEVRFTGEAAVASVHPDVAVCLFRIAQEALRNGIVHGGAGRLAVSVVKSGDDVVLSVTDDGRGFDVEAVRWNGSGLGLVSIEERARLLGGVVEIAAAPGRGTTIRVRVSANAAPRGDPRAAEPHGSISAAS